MTMSVMSRSIGLMCAAVISMASDPEFTDKTTYPLSLRISQTKSRTTASSSTSRMVSLPVLDAAASGAGILRSGAWRAGNGDAAATLFYDTINSGEAEAAALTDFFGGEERFKNPRHYIGGDAVAGVCD